MTASRSAKSKRRKGATAAATPVVSAVTGASLSQPRPGPAPSQSAPSQPRFDPPPPGAAAREIDHVLGEVEQLSQGISGLLQHASDSAIGLTEAAGAAAASAAGASAIAVSDVAASGDASVASAAAASDDGNDGEMMQVFDEEAPGDIRHLDQMLAQQADGLMQEQFDEVDDVLAGGGASNPPAGPAARSETATAQAAAPTVQTATGPQIVQAHAQAVSAAPPAPAVAPAMSPGALAAPIGISQAAPLAAAALAVAQPAMDEPPSVGGTMHLGEGSVAAQPQANASFVSDSQAMASTGATVTATARAPAAAVAPATASTSTAAASAGSDAAAASPARPRKRPGAAIMGALALSNLPLRFVPPGLRPALNVLAASLALWAPAVWVIGPHIAAQHSADVIQLDTGSLTHAHSSLKNEEGGGAEGGHGDAHSGKSSKASSSGGSHGSSSHSTAKSNKHAATASHH